MATIIHVLAVLGFLLSFYALIVKWKSEARPNYKPLCDISEHVSCTKAFTSRYGRIAGLPNPVYGLMFYAIISVLDVYGLRPYIMLLSAVSVLGSVYLAYVSYVKQKNFCLICTAIYVINVLLLLFSYRT